MSIASPAATRPPETAVEVVALAHDGRGIARDGGKTVFVEGALPGERVTLRQRRRGGDFDEARIGTLLRASPDRVEPRCAHYEACGGCALQHMDPAAQLVAKQRSVLETLGRIGKVAPERELAPLAGPAWGYRRRARLGARLVRKKGRVLVGFRERQGRYIADLERCVVLDPRASELLRPLGELFGSLSIPDRLPQVEVAGADDAMALVLRILAPLTDDDRAKLRGFARAHAIEWWIQPGGEESAAPLDPPGTPLRFGLAQAGDPAPLDIEFRPTDFIQVNGVLNRAMVAQAMQLLQPTPGQKVLDLFCGLGNFTLPIARAGASATGVEGSVELVARARTNAARQGIDAEFHVADLFQPLDAWPWARERYDALLLDPPRAGAREAIAHLPRWRPARIVYVSCHPATLARDAGLLVHEHGYRLEAAGAMDMFPQTAHVEAMAMFEI
jgi:23S rRNA (uracil1939-C5)-methyltransferase